MELSDHCWGQYTRDGYLFFPGLLAAEELGAAAAGLAR